MFADYGTWDDFMNDPAEGAAPDVLDWILITVTTIVITVVLFNLIVSIFTDVYGTIKENMEAYDIEVLNEVTMDVEVYCHWLFYWRSFYKKYEN